MKPLTMYISAFLLTTASMCAAQPMIVSSAFASTNPAVATQPVMFTFGADESGAVLTYMWDFGDGSTGTGAEVEHTYAASGIFNVNVTASDGKGGQVGDMIQLAVVDPGSTVLSANVTGATGKFSQTKSGTDSFSMKGVIFNVPAAGNPSGKSVALNLEGIVLNANAKGKGTGGTIKLKTSKKFTGGNIPFQVSLTKGSFLNAFVSAGLDPHPPFPVQGLGLTFDISYLGSAATTTSGAGGREPEPAYHVVGRVFFGVQLAKELFTMKFSPGS